MENGTDLTHGIWQQPLRTGKLTVLSKSQGKKFAVFLCNIDPVFLFSFVITEISLYRIVYTLAVVLETCISFLVSTSITFESCSATLNSIPHGSETLSVLSAARSHCSKSFGGSTTVHYKPFHPY
ncbi:hypothetical protein BDR05DRAFT_963164 [Suillus weaverae]|nr:hypothetical protein BDR05DRAFT_963164 [Suillus weaverae]